MNIQQFNHLVNTTNQLIDDEDAKRLENLVTSFPYCQTGHLLLSKASRDQGSMLSEMRIKTASAYSVNRRHLKRFLLKQNQPILLPAIPEQKVVAIEPLIEKTDQIENQTDVEEVVGDNQNVLEQVGSGQFEVSVNDQEAREEKTGNSSLTIAEEIHQSLEELRKLKGEAKEGINLLTKPQQESDNENTTDLKKEEKTSLLSPVDEVLVTGTKEFGADKADKSEDSPEKKKSPDAIKDKLKELSKKIKQEGKIKAQRKKKIPGEISYYLPNEDLIDSKLGESGGGKENSEADLVLKYLESINKKKTKRAGRKTQEAILDNFIKNEPQISRITPIKSKGTESQEDFSKGSARLKIKVVNENMAKIHAKQGNTAKAIKIYQALIVKKPEKKSYFASQIEKLKKQQ